MKMRAPLLITLVTRARGFTLIEVMVALAVLALMATLSWRGIDTIVRTNQQIQRYDEQIQALQTTLAQWSADLDNQVSPAPALMPGFSVTIDWDGNVLRLVRRVAATDAQGVQVVAWSQRNVDGANYWLRWQSPPVRDRASLLQAWEQADLWAKNPGSEAKKREVRTIALEDWQIFYYRNDTWSNPLSSATATNPTAPSALGGYDPNQIQGVRLVLNLRTGGVIGGTLTRDWVRPNFSRDRS